MSLFSREQQQQAANQGLYIASLIRSQATTVGQAQAFRVLANTTISSNATVGAIQGVSGLQHTSAQVYQTEALKHRQRSF